MSVWLTEALLQWASMLFPAGVVSNAALTGSTGSGIINTGAVYICFKALWWECMGSDGISLQTFQGALCTVQPTVQTATVMEKSQHLHPAV